MRKKGLKQVAENVWNFVTRIKTKKKSNKNTVWLTPPGWCLLLTGHIIP